MLIASQFRTEVDVLKWLARVYVFGAPALVAQQIGQRRVIGELFEILFRAADRSSPDVGLIPEPFREGLEELKDTSGKDRERKRARLVSDIIASMTEQQALLLHQRLNGTVSGSIRDVILY